MYQPQTQPGKQVATKAATACRLTSKLWNSGCGLGLFYSAHVVRRRSGSHLELETRTFTSWLLVPWWWWGMPMVTSWLPRRTGLPPSRKGLAFTRKNLYAKLVKIPKEPKTKKEKERRKNLYGKLKKLPQEGDPSATKEQLEQRP